MREFVRHLRHLRHLRNLASLYVGTSLRRSEERRAEGNAEHRAILQARIDGDAERAIERTALHHEHTIALALASPEVADAASDVPTVQHPPAMSTPAA